MDGSVEFYRPWKDYTDGFGNVSGEYWLGKWSLINKADMSFLKQTKLCTILYLRLSLKYANRFHHALLLSCFFSVMVCGLCSGNQMLHALTDYKAQELRVDLQDHEGVAVYAQYGKFIVGSQINKFMLNVSSYKGDAGKGIFSEDLELNVIVGCLVV